MNKHQRALRAARAAKRIPLVGTAVVAAPLLEAAAASNIGHDFMSVQGWKNFFDQLRFVFTGTNNAGNIDGSRIVATWLPIGVYVASYKFGLAKYPSKILGKLGLRF